MHTRRQLKNYANTQWRLFTRAFHHEKRHRTPILLPCPHTATLTNVRQQHGRKARNHLDSAAVKRARSRGAKDTGEIKRREREAGRTVKRARALRKGSCRRRRRRLWVLHGQRTGEEMNPWGD